MFAKRIFPALAVAMLIGTAFHSAAAQGFDNIRPRGNGETEVRMSRDCVIRYDRTGYRIRERGCSGDDITRSDQEFASYRAGFQGDGRGFRDRDDRDDRGRGFGPGNIRQLGGGRTELRMSGDCAVVYDRTGYRIRQDGCSGDDVTRADREYAGTRR